MSTGVTSQVRKLANDVKTSCGLSSAVVSGTIGDLAHESRGGYHIGRRFQPATNYSVVRPDDKGGRDDVTAAIDWTLNAADMKTLTSRLVKAYDNAADPRRKYLNAFNGTTDGKAARRWDVYARKVGTATSDHLWHVHLEIRRVYTESDTAMAGILSVCRGESVESYLKGLGVQTAQPSSVPAYPGRVLKRNDSQKAADAAVKTLQQRLIDRGWKSLGSADGFFGPKLEAVVKKFQAQAKLTADGLVGPKTWQAAWTLPIT